MATRRNGLRDITNRDRAPEETHDDKVDQQKNYKGFPFNPRRRPRSANKKKPAIESVLPASREKPECQGHGSFDFARYTANILQHSGRGTDFVAKISDDPQYATEYAQQIFQYLHQKEQAPDMRIHKGFLQYHTEVNPRMRSILLDWLIEVHYKFKLIPETLFLCLNLIDRYLQLDHRVPKKKLQLLGGTCMLIASKYEEYRPPEVRDICYIMDNAYLKEDILDMECKILNTLRFGCTTASPLQFLEFFSRCVCCPDSDLYTLAQFCLECSVIDNEMTSYLPSQLACVALYVAGRIMSQDVDIPTPYNEELLRKMESELMKVISTQKDKALGKKYAKDRYRNVMSHVRRYGFEVTNNNQLGLPKTQHECVHRQKAESHESSRDSARENTRENVQDNSRK